MITLRSRLTAFAFAILLLLPTLDQFLGLSSRFTSTENRSLKRVPALNFPHLRSFAYQFDLYYKESFGWRNTLFYFYSLWKFNILGQSPLPEKVVVGKNGWLYLGNSYNKVIDQHRGMQPLSADSAQIIVKHLQHLQQNLANQNMRLYVIIAPDSHTIYPEYLPDNLQRSPAPSRLDILKQAVARTNLHFVDIRDKLLEAKRDHVVYYQTDTHWNEYGTLVGCTTLLNHIRYDIPTISPVQLSDYHIEQQPRGISGDLITMLMLQDNLPKDQVTYYIKPTPGHIGMQTAIVPGSFHKMPSTRFVGTGTNKLLLVGDSFSQGMMQYMAGYFCESYFVRDSKLDPALIKTEKPDVVVIEIVERNINELATF